MHTLAPQVITARVLPRSRVSTVLAVVGFAALTALAAQWRIPLPFTPVPITGQTFAVLLSGAALGMSLGAASQALYLAAGAVGLPVFTEASGGIDVFAGATAGYLFGFVVAAAVVGRLAEHRFDRRIPGALVAFAAGSLIIYVCGVVGLIVNIDMTLRQAIAQGVVPFLVGDAVKAGAAGLLLPATWKLVGTPET